MKKILNKLLLQEKKAKVLKKKLRSAFILELISTDGFYILNYIDIVDKTSKVRCSEVISHIVKKTGFKFNKQQVAIIHLFIKKIGGLKRHMHTGNIYRNIGLRD
jgi:arginine/ornithine N-succinyltransferase beta subunit